ncbi:hypothetical protein IAU60_000347 [Kwoniella sp. DSM 27419]
MFTDNRVILVTGANKGIGYEAVKLLSQKVPSGTILLGSRSTQNGQDAIKKMKESVSEHSFDNVKTIALDITDRQSLDAAVKHIREEYKKLDVLINNSGVSHVGGDGNSEGIFDVNVRGAKDCIEAFAPLIPEGGIVNLVSSEVGSWTTHTLDKSIADKLLSDPPSQTWEKTDEMINDWIKHAKGGSAKEPWNPTTELTAQGYCVSKSLVTPWLRYYATQHPELKVVLTCPGYCATELNNWQGPRPASQGGESIIWPLFNDFENGLLYQDGKPLPWSMKPYMP